MNIYLRKCLKALGWMHYYMERLYNRLIGFAYCAMLKKCGKNIQIDYQGFYSFKNITLGDDVGLGSRPVLLAANSEIRIGSHVMFGPQVVVIGGGHDITLPGCYMTKVHEKTGAEDLGVVIEDDVWIGARAVILRGVTVGRGAVVGAASVVTKSVPPYAIVAGNPACVVKYRWDVETILNHESLLYPPEQRINSDVLRHWQAEKKMLPPLRLSTSKREC